MSPAKKVAAPIIKPTVRIEQVSPALADKWLGTQERNRDLRESRVLALIRAIERGEWELTNDCVSFDTDGRLINGQHRLSAIVISEQTLPLVVLRGLVPKAQSVMDTGLMRKTADALKMRGEKSVHALAAGLSFEHRLRYIEREDRADEMAVHYADTSERPTTPQLLAIFDEDPETFTEITSDAGAFNRVVAMRAGVGIACRRRMYLVNAAQYAEFAEGLLTGGNLPKSSPILQLRQILITSGRSSTRRGGLARMPNYREGAMICKAWNLWRDGDVRRTLTWHYGGSHREPFPIPR